MDLNLGQVVKSKAGRDSGKNFLIYEIIDEEYVKIVDGDLRKVDKPKIKKLKHLNVSTNIVQELRNKFENNSRVMDEEIRKVLEQFP